MPSSSARSGRCRPRSCCWTRTKRVGTAPSLPADDKRGDRPGRDRAVGGSCGAAYCGYPTYGADIAGDLLWRDFKDLALAHRLRACWSVPILAEDDQVLGTFALYYREPRSPTEDDRALIERAAACAAALIERERGA